MSELVSVPAASASVSAGSTPSSAMYNASSLTGPMKAAIVVRVMLNEGADIPLERLPENLQAVLTKAMGTMRSVDKDTVDQVLEEFITAVDRIGLRFPGNMAGALSDLNGKINANTAERLRKEAGIREVGDPWERISEQDPDNLLQVLENESTEVSAVMISKLPVKKAAGLLGRMPGPRARAITYAVSQTGSIHPDAVDRIGRALAKQLSARPARAFDVDPVERVGAILNSTTSLTRDDVLEGLEEKDEGFATAVRKAIFTFANIPSRIAPRDIPRVLRDLDQTQLVTALAGAENLGMKRTADYIFENMSARMADQLRENIAETAPPKDEEVEEAMSIVVETIRSLESAGELILLSDEN